MTLPEPITLTVNGAERAVTTDPGRSLLEVLREGLGLTGAKYGCGEGVCGVCSVLVDGEPRRACVLAVGDVTGRSVETIEGLRSDPDFPAVASSFIKTRAFQCGYCTPGMVTESLALLRREPHLEPEAIVEALNGHLPVRDLPADRRRGAPGSRRRRPLGDPGDPPVG